MKRRPTLERFLPRDPETRRMVFVAAGLFLGSAVVTLVIVLATGGPRPRPEQAAPAAGESDSAEAFGSVGLSDLILEPNAGFAATPQLPPGGSEGAVRDLRDARAAGQAPPYLLRAPLERWSQEQVERYWIPLSDIAVDRVRQENDRRIRELFEGVP